MLRRSILTLFVAALLIGTTASIHAADNGLAGAWTLVKYEGPASHGTASGQLIVTGNRFNLVYTMDENGQRWARAHAGTCDVRGNRLTFHVAWSFEYVSGKPAVAAAASDSETTFSLSGDTLTVTFANSAVQTFTRVR